MPTEKTRVYILRNSSENTWRIRAQSYVFSSDNDKFATFHFNGVDGAKGSVILRKPYEVFAEDMLLSPLENDLVFPDMPANTGGRDLDPFTEALFSEAEKAPFTPQERRLLHAVLDRAKNRYTRNSKPRNPSKPISTASLTT